MPRYPVPTRRTVFLGGLGLAAFAAGCAGTPPDPVAVSETTELVATVETVDQTKREVLLRGPTGRKVTVVVPPTVRNLAQVRAGDTLRVVFQEAVAFTVAPVAGTPGATPTLATGVARAPEGSMPGIAAADSLRVRVRVDQVAAGGQSVAFTGPSGVQRVAFIRDPQLRQFVTGLQPGTDVDVVYREALAVRVEPMARPG
ncbi:hypothetical protein LPC08_09585 [Roseomonas sp. OT10]|uniref:hypothetical protein n=1 Tax=Roseomonas cutis TaxID=2897332 RepID=UPI001E4C15EB|nr:hypothetical protein [Roseomonas sp. OT10]UFN50833.1 hypothetical protein LPC08_09585 [Roseomonas sp. OT10]